MTQKIRDRVKGIQGSAEACDCISGYPVSNTNESIPKDNLVWLYDTIEKLCDVEDTRRVAATTMEGQDAFEGALQALKEWEDAI